jgi:predicted RNA-binding protein YlxR (DUF448 family)
MQARKQPTRTCVACRTERPKRELVRIVRTPTSEVLVDLSGKRSGRGAYLCPSVECLKLAIKRKALERALGITVGEQLRHAIEAQMPSAEA